MAPIKVAVLDDYHDLYPTEIARLPSSEFEASYFPETLLPYSHPDTPDSVKTELVERLKPFTVISCIRERTPFPSTLLEQLPNLKFLQSTGGRNKAIDLDACKRLGIRVAGTTGKGRTDGPKPTDVKKGPDSTTQHAVTLILSLARNIAEDDKRTKNGGAWQTKLMTGLAGETLGVVGLGRLGANVAKIMHTAFGMRVVAWSENLTQEGADQKAIEAGLSVDDAEIGGKTFTKVSKEELFRTADVVSVHYVLSDRSRGVVSKKDLEIMKPTALFVNTSRGPLVLEKDLLDVVKAGKIKGVALDVYDIEPLPQSSEWRNANWGQDGTSRVLLTPHSAYVEEETMNNWAKEVVENIELWHAGKELNSVLV